MVNRVSRRQAAEPPGTTAGTGGACDNTRNRGASMSGGPAFRSVTASAAALAGNSRDVPEAPQVTGSGRNIFSAGQGNGRIGRARQASNKVNEAEVRRATSAERNDGAMRKILRNSTLVVIFTGLLAAAPMLAFGDAKAPLWTDPPNTNASLEHQVRHELLMLPYYGVFDNLEYKVVGNHVELLGQVVDPNLKYEAGNVVKAIKGVKGVTNKIQVLPLFTSDWQIRLAEYRAVFGHAGLYRYAMGANPSIHIIVDSGHVTLVGVVGSQMDKNIAGIEANGVSGVFSVTNLLRVA